MIILLNKYKYWSDLMNLMKYQEMLYIKIKLKTEIKGKILKIWIKK